MGYIEIGYNMTHWFLNISELPILNGHWVHDLYTKINRKEFIKFLTAIRFVYFLGISLTKNTLRTSNRQINFLVFLGLVK